MKITFLLPFAGISGGIRVVALYADRLQKRGHYVTIVSMPHWLQNRKALLRDFFTRRLVMKAKRQEEPSFLRELVNVEQRVLDRVRPIEDRDVPDGDIVIATWWETAEWAWALSERKGAKVYFLQGFDGSLGQPIDRVKGTWALPMHKIVVSKWLADMARDEFDDDNVSTVPNSVDLQQFYAPPRGKQSTPTVGTIYSTKDYRGCRQVFEAIERTAGRVGELKLLSFGIGPEDRSALALPGRCTYSEMPPQEQLRNIYSSCDAWILGAEREGFGLPILEAFACRTPVVATKAGAAPELLAAGTDGQAPGVLVDFNNIEQMTDAITQVLTQSEESWKRMSNRALEIAQSYTWDDATDLFEKALETAAEQSKRCMAVTAGR